MRTFELKVEHLTLLRNACWEWQDCETGAPAMDPKRPYGNSNVPRDVAEILEWDFDPDEDLPEDIEEAAMALHRETETALEVITCALSLRLGVYENQAGTVYARPKWVFKE